MPRFQTCDFPIPPVALTDIQRDISDNEKALMELSEDIDELNRRMDKYLQNIKAQHQFYRTC